MIAADLNLSVIQLAYIHSAFLAGYLVGHIPAGLLADGRYGGAKVLCAGMTIDPGSASNRSMCSKFMQRVDKAQHATNSPS